MPMNKRNTKTTYRTVFAGMVESVTLLKRGDDLQQGTVRAIVLFNCRKSMIHKTGEMIQRDEQTNHRVVWHIPTIELERVGVAYINPTDRIVQREGVEKGWTWMPEATTLISLKLLSNEWDLHCLRTDPTDIV